ncbi:MAG TPA: o-succinylbenzoate synthase [Opitutaceae bacterium]
MITHRLAYRRYALPLRAPVRTAHGVWTVREGLIVRAETPEGQVGYGEAAPIPGFGRETVGADEAMLHKLGDTIHAERLAVVPSELGALRQALAAATGPTVGAARREHLPVAALLPAGRDALKRIEPFAEAGFRTFKWKVGVGDTADEIVLLDDVLARLPEGAKLRLDANGAWDRRTAERWLGRCADCPIEHVEQPIAAGARQATDLLLGLAGDYPTPIALDESLVGAGDVEHWLEVGWPGIFVVKPALLGDSAQVLERLATARARVVFSSALETAVGAQHALRTAFAWAGDAEVASKPAPVRALGFGVWPLFADARFDGPALAPFVRRQDVDRIDAEAVWNALS